MSKENKEIVEVYKEKAGVYLKNSINHDNLNPEKAKCKRKKLEEFIKKNIESLPKAVRVLEIESGKSI